MYIGFELVSNLYKILTYLSSLYFLGYWRGGVITSNDNNNSTQSSATTLGGTKGNRFQAKINAALEDNDSDEHDVKRARNDDDKSDSLWDRIKKGIEADSDDSNYNSSYLHPLSMHISTSTAKLICTSLSTTERLTSNNRVLLDYNW